MSISINKENRLLITCNAGVDGYAGAITRINSLLHILSQADHDCITQDDVFNICDLILDILPSDNQLFELQRLEQGK